MRPAKRRLGAATQPSLRETAGNLRGPRLAVGERSSERKNAMSLTVAFTFMTLSMFTAAGYITD